MPAGALLFLQLSCSLLFLFLFFINYTGCALLGQCVCLHFLCIYAVCSVPAHLISNDFKCYRMPAPVCAPLCGVLRICPGKCAAAFLLLSVGQIGRLPGLSFIGIICPLCVLFLSVCSLFGGFGSRVNARLFYPGSSCSSRLYADKEKRPAGGCPYKPLFL